MRSRMFVALAFCLLIAFPAMAQDNNPRVLMVQPAQVDVTPTPEPVVADATPVVEEIVAVQDASVQTEDVPANVDPTAPSTMQDVQSAGDKVMDAVGIGGFAAIAGAVIFLILQLFRLPQFGSLTSKIPQRWRIVVTVLLAALSGVLNAVALGTPWLQAMWAALITAPNAVFANELFMESILGQRYKKQEVMKSQLAEAQAQLAETKPS